MLLWRVLVARGDIHPFCFSVLDASALFELASARWLGDLPRWLGLLLLFLTMERELVEAIWVKGDLHFLGADVPGVYVLYLRYRMLLPGTRVLTRAAGCDLGGGRPPLPQCGNSLAWFSLYLRHRMLPSGLCLISRRLHARGLGFCPLAWAGACRSGWFLVVVAVGLGFIDVHVWASSEVNGIGIDYAEGGHAWQALAPPPLRFRKAQSTLRVS